MIHVAALHKPHVATHPKAAFVDVNIAGTLNLLEASVDAGVRSFVLSSTTSAFGHALRPPEGEPAAWITEDVAPRPRNIYGVTKTSAEDLCALFAQEHGLPCVVLRTARFFPEEDDNPAMADAYAIDNLKVNELLHRRLDIEDAVEGHLLAADRAPSLGFDRLILSATTPFQRDDLAELRIDPPAVVRRYVPAFEAVYRDLGWRLYPSMDRVYVNRRARVRLGWRPRYDFAGAIESLRSGASPFSALGAEIGSKGYAIPR